MNPTYWHLFQQIQNVKNYEWNKMTYNEIYKILSFEKTKLITTILLCPQDNLIIIIGSAKQRRAEI
jgi:hypothetical protein